MRNAILDLSDPMLNYDRRYLLQDQNDTRVSKEVKSTLNRDRRDESIAMERKKQYAARHLS